MIAKAETSEMARTLPESVLDAALALVPYCCPTTLAEMVDYWSDIPEYLPLAQIAFDEGESNCGAMELAESVASRDRRSSRVLEEWHKAGVEIRPITFD